MSTVVVIKKTTFQDRLQTLRVQHAVAQGGQHIMLVVFTTLFLGELSNIKGFVESHLPSKRQYKDSFTKPEQEKLEVGNYSTWDISILFKLLQKVCGLNPNVSDWKQFGRDTLEKLLDELKDLRNDMAHTLDTIFTEKERDEKLEEFRDLCLNILTKLNEKKQIGNDAVHQHYESVEYILNDVKKPINETLNSNLQRDSAPGTISKNAISSPASPTSTSFAASAGFASASAAAGFPKSAYSAAASADIPVAEGYLAMGISASHKDYHHDGAEAMDVDDDYADISGEKSIINQLVKGFWEFAGPGFITV